MDVPVFLSDVDKTQIGLIYKGGELTFTGIVDAYPKKMSSKKRMQVLRVSRPKPRSLS
ncbi:hypothetical protein [uncultured Maribacter sp.]|uniref:hypothetical protein n=1 Tax=uncultured Maribacter sp. TaxID=431308 RepID=UPI0030DCCCB3